MTDTGSHITLCIHLMQSMRMFDTLSLLYALVGIEAIALVIVSLLLSKIGENKMLPL